MSTILFFKRSLTYGFWFIVIGLSFGQTGRSQVVTKIEHDPNVSLQQRWDEVHSMAKSKGYDHSYWIGYCISRLMEKNSYIGSFDTRKRNSPSLFETVYGVKIESEPEPHFDNDCGSFNGNITIGDGKDHHEKIVKKVAVLVLLDGDNDKIHDVKVSNMSLHADLKEKPVLWIEGATNEESVALLKTLYGKTENTEIEKDIVTAVALHESSDEMFSFLTDVAKNNTDTDVREEAVFWTGEQKDDRALPFLTTTARTDQSESVREKAIFSISEVSTDASIDTLISLARKGYDKDMRSKALFWLAEKASHKAIQTMKDVIDDDNEDTEVQKQALFALTQTDDKSGGIDELIEVAKSHHNPKIRKEAIFWLGQSDDPKAVDALVAIVKR